jgi:hypothetical protein
MKTLKNQKTENLGYFNYSLLYDETVKSNIEKWIVGLRSGELKQGQSHLYNAENDTYCCLGVANKVCNLGETHACGLVKTYKKIGLPNEGCGAVLGSDLMDFPSLASLNDSHHWTFVEIAQLLEDQLKVCLKTIEGEQNERII